VLHSKKIQPKGTGHKGKYLGVLAFKGVRNGRRGEKQTRRESESKAMTRGGEKVDRGLPKTHWVQD